MISRPKTYADYVPPAEGKSYQISGNSDGTSKITDVTQYLSDGTNWGATDANAVWDALESVDETADETAGKFNADGVLTVQNGGTGATTVEAARENLGAYPSTGGVLNGSVWATSTTSNTEVAVSATHTPSGNGLYLYANADARGLFDSKEQRTVLRSPTNSSGWSFDGNAVSANTLSEVLPISLGGTGATTADQARRNIGAFPNTGGSVPGSIYSDPGNNNWTEIGVTRRGATDTNQLSVFAMSVASDLKTGSLVFRFASSGGSVSSVNLTDTGILLRAPNAVYCYTSTGGTGIPIYASAFTNNSSIKYKEHIKEITSEKADNIYSLRPVTFDFKDGGRKNVAGMIAEEVEPLFPEVCAYDTDENGNKTLEGLNYAEFVPYLIKAVQDLKEEVDLLKNQINGTFNEEVTV